MFTPETSKHFKKYVDKSGVVSYILTTRVAPIQQSFYFTSTCMTDNGRYLWFWGKFPPSIINVCFVLDFETDEIIPHYETISAQIGQVDTEGDDYYFTNGNGLYKVKANNPEEVTEIANKSVISYTPFDRFEKNLKGDPPCNGMYCQHLMWANDKKTCLLEPQFIVNGSRIGTINIETGEYEEWLQIHGNKYHHAQICPADPTLGLVNEDFYIDAVTGEYKLIRKLEDGTLCRIVLVRKDGTAKVIPPMFKERATHEWWAADGKSFYSVDMTMGLCRYTMDDGKWELRVPGKAWHGYCSKNEKYYVSDIDLVEQNFRGCESRVRFFNYETKKDVFIITENPRWNAPDKQNSYHMDPHPQFTCNDKYVAHTVTVDGHIDVAITPVDQLIEMTK